MTSSLPRNVHRTLTFLPSGKTLDASFQRLLSEVFWSRRWNMRYPSQIRCHYCRSVGLVSSHSCLSISSHHSCVSHLQSFLCQSHLIIPVCLISSYSCLSFLHCPVSASSDTFPVCVSFISTALCPVTPFLLFLSVSVSSPLPCVSVLWHLSCHCCLC